MTWVHPTERIAASKAKLIGVRFKERVRQVSSWLSCSELHCATFPGLRLACLGLLSLRREYLIIGHSSVCLSSPKIKICTRLTYALVFSSKEIHTGTRVCIFRWCYRLRDSLHYRTRPGGFGRCRVYWIASCWHNCVQRRWTPKFTYNQYVFLLTRYR